MLLVEVHYDVVGGGTLGCCWWRYIKTLLVGVH